MFRILIVDDEAPARKRMKKLLEKEKELKIIAEAESGAQAIEQINALKPDLVLLDIQLKDMTAFEVLSSLSEGEREIIFITAYDEFALKAFEENAIDYLLKPYKKERFLEAINRAKFRLKNQQLSKLEQVLKQLAPVGKPGKLKIPEGNSIHLIEADALICIKADTYYCHFHLEDKRKKVIRISLKKLEALLPSTFLRINRSVIINKDKIESMKQRRNKVDLELKGGFEFISDKEIFFN